MRKQLKNIFSLFLAAAIIFASTGVVIASHACSAKKKSDVSLFENKNCCGKKGKTCASFPSSSSELKKNCCQLSISYHKLDVSSLQKISLKTTIISFLAEQVFFQHGAGLSQPTQACSHEDPPGIQKLKPGTKNFLHSIHLLLI